MLDARNAAGSGGDLFGLAMEGRRIFPTDVLGEDSGDLGKARVARPPALFALKVKVFHAKMSQ